MPGRPRIYPWNEWFRVIESGSELKLTAGVDFQYTPDRFRSQITVEARKRQVPISTRLERPLYLYAKKRKIEVFWDARLTGDLVPQYLTQGRDFTSTVERFTLDARAEAAIRGMLVIVTENRNVPGVVEIVSKMKPAPAALPWEDGSETPGGQ